MAKKSAQKVDSTPVAVVQSGKRGTQQTINKVVSAKKQKIVKDETLQKVVGKNLPEKVEISASEHDSSEPEVEPKDATISAPADVPQELVNNLSNDSDSEEEVEEIDNMASATANGDTIVNEESNDDENSEDDSEEEIETLATEQASSDSDEASEEEAEDEQPAETPKKKTLATEQASSDSDEASEDEAEDEEPAETPKKKNSDVKMLDADSGKKANKTPATPQTGKTLFIGNLAFRIEEDDVRDFFKTSGEVVEVRFATDRDGKFKGFGHVEFATPEDAQKALALNGQELLERSVRLDLARERTEKREEGSFQKSGRSQGGGTTASATAFIKGFDTSLGEDEVRIALQNHFGSCGSITRLSIPPNHDTGGVKGMAYIDFAEPDGFSKAMELDGTDLGEGFNLTVIEAKPRGDSGGGRGGRGRGGGRFGGRGDSGGRRGGGRRGGRGGRGRSSRF